MRIKISIGAERDMEDGCDFYCEIDPNLATYFHDSISADIDSLLLYAGVHAKSDGWYYTFASRFPLHVVCSWLGNSPRIAKQSYLLVTEDDFARAAGARNVMVEG